VKVFLRAAKPGARCRKAYRDGEVEMYDHGRFFVVTGRRLPDVPSGIECRQKQLDGLYHRVFGHDRQSFPRVLPPIVPALEDQEVTHRASQARNGAKFQALWLGDTSGYRSDSEADLALCGLLAFWVGLNPDRVDQLFRQSGLCDEKWLEREDYRTATIAKAIAERTQYYEPHRLSPAARIAMRAALAQGDQHG
jgi:primase-polymerase (primpol)-like protein